MCKTFLFVTGALLFALPSAASGEAIQATHAVELEDAAGDVLNEGGDLGKDVVKLQVASDGKELLFTMVLADDVAAYLAGRKAGDVIEVNLDTDNDVATGGKTFWGDKEGFETLVSIRACIQYEDGEACVGGLSSTEKSYFSSYDVGAFAQGATDTTDTHDIFWNSPRTDITGREIVVHVPYTDIGVVSGQTIRMAIREADSTYDAASFFPEVLLTLK